MIVITQILNNNKCGEEILPGREVCHQGYIKADKGVHGSCARMRGIRFAESGPFRI